MPQVSVSAPSSSWTPRVTESLLNTHDGSLFSTSEVNDSIAERAVVRLHLKF